MKFLILLLRLLPPEIAHSVALNALNILYIIGLSKFLFPAPTRENSFAYKNLKFKNRLGIAAGLDKNGDYIDSLGSLGFGFLEIGTVTPLPQAGNPKPRIFRFLKQHAIVNRLGFNNKGLDYLISKVKSRKYAGILGINIGANKDSEGQKRIDDYIECFNKVSPYADYITVNISSPNTPNLRALHARENFEPLFSALNITRIKLDFTKPVFIKLSPDESKEVIADIIQAVREYKFDGVIASNTTINHSGLTEQDSNRRLGGLSGKPLFKKSNALLASIHENDHDLFKIGVGGVFSPIDFNKKLELGASLVQIYTSFIYEGPGIVSKLLT
jgi:dihydroorotate dehydrogenase|tara:strand:- start:231 stop:1217 length:987 start_codon:yes stop_codon:yes gene_type:complete